MEPLRNENSEASDHGRRVAGLSTKLAEKLGSAPPELFELCNAFDEAVEFAALDAVSISEAMAAFFEGCARSPAATQLASLTGFGSAGIDTSAISLPVMPQQIARLLRTSSETSSCAELERIAASDPVLAGRLLGAANSALHGRFTIVRLRNAVMHLGIPETRRVLLASCLTGLFASKPLQSLWKHSQAVAATAGNLALLSDIDPETAYLSGLLHDIGRLGFLKLSSKKNVRAQEWTAAGFPVAYAETLAYGLDHAALGAQLLRDWELPAQIIEAVRTHHRPGHSQSELGAILCIAEERMAQTSQTNSEDLWPALRQTAACVTLKITPAELGEFLRDSASRRKSA